MARILLRYSVLLLFGVLTFAGCSDEVELDLHKSELCADPRIDALVMLGNAKGKALIIKGPNTWLFDMDGNDQEDKIVSWIATEQLFKSCYQAGKELFVWTHPHGTSPDSDRVCFHQENRTCDTYLEYHMPGFRLSKDSYSIPSSSDQSVGSCAQFIHGPTIEYGKFSVRPGTSNNENSPKGSRTVELIGDHFVAQLAYAAPIYESDYMMLNIGVTKTDGMNREARPEGRERFFDVRTLAVDEGDHKVMAFFDDYFCFLDYSDHLCKERSLVEMLGCPAPEPRSPVSTPLPEVSTESSDDSIIIPLTQSEHEEDHEDADKEDKDKRALEEPVISSTTSESTSPTTTISPTTTASPVSPSRSDPITVNEFDHFFHRKRSLNRKRGIFNRRSISIFNLRLHYRCFSAALELITFLTCKVFIWTLLSLIIYTLLAFCALAFYETITRKQVNIKLLAEIIKSHFRREYQA